MPNIDYNPSIAWVYNYNYKSNESCTNYNYFIGRSFLIHEYLYKDDKPVPITPIENYSKQNYLIIFYIFFIVDNRYDY